MEKMWMIGFLSVLLISAAGLSFATLSGPEEPTTIDSVAAQANLEVSEDSLIDDATEPTCPGGCAKALGGCGGDCDCGCQKKESCLGGCGRARGECGKSCEGTGSCGGSCDGSCIGSCENAEACPYGPGL